MYVGRDFSPMEHEESEVVGLDFVNDLEHDEVLVSSKWTVEVKQGYDPDPDNILEGPSKVVEPIGSELKTASIQRVGGVVPNVTYTLHATVITSFGNTKALFSHVRGVPIE